MENWVLKKKNNNDNQEQQSNNTSSSSGHLQNLKESLTKFHYEASDFKVNQDIFKTTKDQDDDDGIEFNKDEDKTIKSSTKKKTKKKEKRSSKVNIEAPQPIHSQATTIDINSQDLTSNYDHFDDTRFNFELNDQFHTNNNYNNSSNQQVNNKINIKQQIYQNDQYESGGGGFEDSIPADIFTPSKHRDLGDTGSSSRNHLHLLKSKLMYNNDSSNSGTSNQPMEIIDNDFNLASNYQPMTPHSSSKGTATGESMKSKLMSSALKTPSKVSEFQSPHQVQFQQPQQQSTTSNQNISSFEWSNVSSSNSSGSSKKPTLNIQQSPSHLFMNLLKVNSSSPSTISTPSPNNSNNLKSLFKLNQNPSRDIVVKQQDEDDIEDTITNNNNNRKSRSSKLDRKRKDSPIVNNQYQSSTTVDLTNPPQNIDYNRDQYNINDTGHDDSNNNNQIDGIDYVPQTQPDDEIQPQVSILQKQKSSLSSLFGLNRSSSFQKDKDRFSHILKSPEERNSHQNNNNYNGSSLFVPSTQTQQIQTTQQNIVYIPTLVSQSKSNLYSQSSQVPNSQTPHGIIRSSSQLNYDDVESIENDTQELSNSPPPPKFEDQFVRDRFKFLINDTKKDYEEIDEDGIQNNIKKKYNNNSNNNNDNFSFRNNLYTSDEIDGNILSQDQTVKNLQNQFMESLNDTNTPVLNSNTTQQQTPSVGQSLKSKLMEEMVSNDTDLQSDSTKKPFSIKLMKRYEKGGVTSRLMKLLTKQQLNYDILTTKQPQSTISSTLQSTNPNNYNSQFTSLPDHFTDEIKVEIFELPSPLQPHCYVATCYRVEDNDRLSEIHPQGAPLTVIFSMQHKSDWKLDIGSKVTIEYWQLIRSQTELPTITCLIGKLLENENRQEVEEKLEHQFKSISLSNQHISSKQQIILKTNNNENNNSTSIQLYQQPTVDSIKQTYDFMELDMVNQNIIEVNLDILILKCIDFTTKDLQGFYKLLISNKSFTVLGEIQIHEIDFRERWLDLLQDSIYPVECLIVNLQFNSSNNIDRFSIEGSVLSSYLPPNLLPNNHYANYLSFKTRPDSIYLLYGGNHVNNLFYQKDNTIHTVNSISKTITQSPPNIWKRVNIQANISFIEELDRKYIVLYLYQPSPSTKDTQQKQHLEEDTDYPIKNISIMLDKNLKDYTDLMKSFVINSNVLFKDVLVLPPTNQVSTSLLLADKYSTIEVSTNDVGNHDNEDYFIENSLNFQLITENNSLLETMVNYKFIVNIMNATITQATSNQYIYRGCVECHRPVLDFPSDEYVVGYTKEGFFCPNCRILVNSKLMMELNLIIKLDNWIINLKIKNDHCRLLFPNPLNHENAHEYNSEQITNLIGKFIDVFGILTCIRNETNEDDGSVSLVFNLETITSPHIYQMD